MPDHACLDLLLRLDKLVTVIWCVFVFLVEVVVLYCEEYDDENFSTESPLVPAEVFTHENISQLIDAAL